jgi:hypothetical protein
VTTDLDEAGRVPVAADITSASTKRAELHRDLKVARMAVADRDEVRSVSLFEAILFGPGGLDKFPPRGPAGGRPARYDTLLIIETHSPAEVPAVLDSVALKDLIRILRESGTYVRAFPVANVKKIDSVPRDRSGVFLVNFFFADEPQVLLDIWDHTAGWWLKYGNMINSELFCPTGESEYAIINNARWDDAASAIAAFRHPSYWDFVMVNINACRATAMPSLYRLIA